jgi:uncharacterized protein
MQSRMIGFYIWLSIMVLIEAYTYSGLRSFFHQTKYLWLFKTAYLLQMLIVFYAFYQVMLAMQSGSIVKSSAVNIWLGIAITSLVTKLIFSALMMVHDGGRVVSGVVNVINAKLLGGEVTQYIPARRKFLTQAAAAIAAVPFGSMFYGMMVGKYKYTVKNVKLAFADLPKAFEGFKIVQVSDIHSGSFDDITAVQKGVDLINAQQADLLLFTGDLVNSEKDEVNPFMDMFKTMSGKYGKYAVLGNHDYYGMYKQPESKKDAYWADFFGKFKEMGFKLLNNEHTFIEKDGDKLCLAGVENWGAGSHFPKHGDLEQALKGVDHNEFTVLMSHDPSHWDHHVLKHDKHVHLTLSGHTHGMQFGVDLPGIKWSPVKYRYPRWMGAYKEKEQYLYVNRGFGFLAFPGRVGMWPEITVIELTSAV